MSVPTTTDAVIYDSLSYPASTWRSSLGGVPDYNTYGPLANASGPRTAVFYTGTPYSSSPNPDPTFSQNLSAIYGEVFWNCFFETLFPQVYTANYLGEQSTGVPGGYYTQLYEIAMRDFFDSFFRGRDDTGSNLQGTIVTTDMWNVLSYDEQRLIIKKYLFSRSNIAQESYFDTDGQLVFRQYTANMLLSDLSLRTTNVFFYVASLMIRVMQQLQENTINASTYATRLADTQKTISTQMASSQYNYVQLSFLNDYSTQQLNAQNGLALENLRQLRDQFQKQTDRASSFLEVSQQAVEEQGSKGLEFLKKGQQLTQLFFRSL